MSPQRLIAALTLACLPMLSMLPPASAETPAQYVIKVQERTVKLFDNGNVYAVQNGAKRATTFTLKQPARVTKILTYHWNNGQGAEPGTIGLRSTTGETYGPWDADGQPGQGGVPDAYWFVEGELELPAGTYTVLDSDPATWSQNAGTRGAGMVIVEGYR